MTHDTLIKRMTIRTPAVFELEIIEVHEGGYTFKCSLWTHEQKCVETWRIDNIGHLSNDDILSEYGHGMYRALIYAPENELPGLDNYVNRAIHSIERILQNEQEGRFKVLQALREIEAMLKNTISGLEMGLPSDVIEETKKPRNRQIADINDPQEGLT